MNKEPTYDKEKLKIIQEKSPFVAKNLSKKFDEKTTAFVYIFGKKALNYG